MPEIKLFGQMNKFCSVVFEDNQLNKISLIKKKKIDFPWLVKYFGELLYF